jgi:hypothetical protein
MKTYDVANGVLRTEHLTKLISIPIRYEVLKIDMWQYQSADLPRNSFSYTER